MSRTPGGVISAYVVDPARESSTDLANRLGISKAGLYQVSSVKVQIRKHGGLGRAR